MRTRRTTPKVSRERAIEIASNHNCVSMEIARNYTDSELKDMAGTDRWNNNSYFDIAFNALGQFISKVQATDGFAAKIAETVDKTMNPYGKKVAFISDKQSWILAVAAVENNITL